MATQSDGDSSRTAVGAGAPQNNDEGGCEFILYRHLPKLSELLDIDSLRMFLRAEEFLSEDDMAKLKSNPPHYVGSQIVETLVMLVRKKGQKGFKKFLTALRESANAGNQPGHEELLQLLENECKEDSSITQSAEVNVSQKETSDEDPLSNDQVVLIDLEEEANLNVLNPDHEFLLLEDPSVNQRPAGKQKCGQCCKFIKKYCGVGCIILASVIFCLGLGIPQLIVGGMGAAPHASPSNTSVLKASSYLGYQGHSPDQVSPAGFTYCEISFYVYVFFFCVGAFLCSCGLLICIFSVWVAIKDQFPNSHKCVYYTIASTVAVFITVLVPCTFVSLIGTVFIIPTAIILFPIISSISAYQCNHDVLVIYYWVFVEIVIILLIMVLVIIVIIVAMFYKLLKCLTSG